MLKRGKGRKQEQRKESAETWQSAPTVLVRIVRKEMCLDNLLGVFKKCCVGKKGHECTVTNRMLNPLHDNQCSCSFLNIRSATTIRNALFSAPLTELRCLRV